MTEVRIERVEIPRPVSKPQKPLPAGAWDCHAHVFGPYDPYPLIPNPPYQPPLSPCPDYLAMLDKAGFTHGVLVHPSANGWDNATTSDAVSENWPRLRGVAVIPAETGMADLENYDRLGMRGVRITDHGHTELAPGLVRRSTRFGTQASRVHRRDLDRHKHDPQPWAVRQGRAPADVLA
jgi:predicted TIM-barrel fold metal-dependent hydrolase